MMWRVMSNDNVCDDGIDGGDTWQAEPRAAGGGGCPHLPRQQLNRLSQKVPAAARTQWTQRTWRRQHARCTSSDCWLLGLQSRAQIPRRSFRWRSHALLNSPEPKIRIRSRDENIGDNLRETQRFCSLTAQKTRVYLLMCMRIHSNVIIYFTCNLICLISFRFTISRTRYRIVRKIGKLGFFRGNLAFFPLTKPRSFIQIGRTLGGDMAIL